MPAINLVTEVPGPKSRALMSRRQAAVARGPFHATPVFASQGNGAILEDIDGNRLIDFGSGIAVSNLGHCPPQVVRAVQAQAEKFLHSSFNINPYSGYVEVCERLNQITPGSFAKKSFLANSGAEAVENAIKIARSFTKRSAIVCLDHAFHGRTYMAMALTSKAQPYKSGFAPFPSEVYRAPFPYEYRMGAHATDECFAALESVARNQVGANQVAAVILEPVLGEGGFVPAPVEYVSKLRKLCSEIGALLIFDEIQTGFGRTGKLFALNHYDGVEFDLLTLAKGMGSGMPISAVVGRAEIMDQVGEGGIGGTFGGNPLSCEATLSVIDTMTRPEFFDHVRAVTFKMSTRLAHIQSKASVVGDVRGLGPMLGIECVKDRTTKAPHKEATQWIVKEALKNGLITIPCGTFGNVIRLLPPLTIPLAELEEGLSVLEAAVLGWKQS